MLITYTATVIKKEEIAPHIYLIQLNYPENEHWSFQAGQYMIFHLPSKENGHPARRLYSIASSPLQKNGLDFIIEIVPGGLGSTFIEKIHEGEKFTVQGPAGIFTRQESPRDMVLLATGTGIAPMYSMIQEMLLAGNDNPQPNIHLFWGLKHKADIYLKKELDTLADAYSHFQYSICLSREKDSPNTRCLLGRVTLGLQRLIESKKDSESQFDYYLCGSPHVVEALKEDLLKKQVPKNQIFFEKFS